MLASISIRFETTTISIKLSPTSYEVEFPTSYPGISAYIQSEQSHLFLKGQGGVTHKIMLNRRVTPFEYLFETMNRDNVLDVLDILKEAITGAIPASASTLDRAQPASTPARVQAPVEFSNTLKELERLTPDELLPMYLGGKQELDMDLLNTCKVSAQVDGASYKVTIFTFNPNGAATRPLDNMLIDHDTCFCIDFNSTTHRYPTRAAFYDDGHPGFEITIGNHEDMKGLWLALTDILYRFRTAHRARYAPDYDDPTGQGKFAGSIGPRR
jgi:hypothetical protein